MIIPDFNAIMKRAEAPSWNEMDEVNHSSLPDLNIESLYQEEK